MKKTDSITNTDPKLIEQLYEQFKSGSKDLDDSWNSFFAGFELAQTNYSKFSDNDKSEEIEKEFKVLNLIQAYRQRGHLFTKTNPVRLRRKYFPRLDIENFGLNTKDLDSIFQAGNEIGIGSTSLNNIIKHLSNTYCSSVGVEYLYIRHPEMLNWLKDKMEACQNKAEFSAKKKKNIFKGLTTAVGFERFIHKKFVGQKRFSLEGSETLIPALSALIEKGAELGIKEFIFGMAHRGRLNVLANILHKPNSDIFKEFNAENYDDNIALGDVKYHLGYSNIISTNSDKDVKINLIPNPSHLETVGAITQGIAKAKLENDYNNNLQSISPIIIHGDAAISGQGIVYELIQMSQLNAYNNGGTIHIVINNQIGFTTNYKEGRSSTYCTDIAKVIRVPVFHVNGDDAEAMIYAIELAMEYRQIFHTDVFIDILSYRKYGHNEGDEPRYTQPLLYKTIAKHPNPRDIYAQKLINEGVYSESEIKQIILDYDFQLDNQYNLSKKDKVISIQAFLAEYYKNIIYTNKENVFNKTNTNISTENLLKLVNSFCTLPEDMSFFKKVNNLMKERLKKVSENKLDWALGELLAYASLVNEKIPVRICGQDSERGTFSHRHAGLTIEDSEEKYYPLKYISDSQANFNIYNSSLSEYAALGFEYGYATAMPNCLTIWEAQFGDFHNVGQAIIDQYISSAEDKWGIRNGMVLLLPHGYEGQGAEHSSARIERFLTLCAQNNMQVCNPSTPSNMFHLLRRQVKRNIRLPLICLTPKSLLRNDECISELNDFTNGEFKEVIDDANVDTEDVRRVVFCSGKIYYDLLKQKKKYNSRDIAIIRIEQLYPFPENQIGDIIKKYTNTLLHLWVQEEPENMGAWQFINYQFRKKETELIPIARLASGSPATGLSKLHTIGQEEIINKVFRKCECNRKLKYCGLQCKEGKSKEEIKKFHEYYGLATNKHTI
ncbi:MAG: 2-oxoglutarate dehydrogenase E1 component [Marinifilaceae bacterium]|jgi:2-oxoglutarate dehydrogenase E1 component|nr:2-oxoglutarate dehydrogenase E1 component [Marinifilaceae bacterium]